MIERRVLAILSLILGVLATGPLLAQLLQMAPKLTLDRIDYRTAQLLDAGWGWTGWVLVLSIACTLAYAWAARREPRRCLLALLSFGCQVGTQALYWTLTFPVNRVTGNWALLPENWMALRDQWEGSQGVVAALAFLGLVTLILAVVEDPPAGAPESETPLAIRAGVFYSARSKTTSPPTTV